MSTAIIGLTREQQEKLDNIPLLHFGVASVSQLTMSTDEDDPTVLGLDSDMISCALFPTSSDEFEIVVNSRNEQWIKNNSGKDLDMADSVTFQCDGSGGGAADLALWSDKSFDDGETFIVNDDSLRTREIGNNDESTEMFPSAIAGWESGSCIRFASYAATGSIPLDGLSKTVHTDQTVSGYSFFWLLKER